MILEAALPKEATQRPLRALDLCAAPGGKTTHLASLLHPDSLILANEVIRARCNPLIENLTRWGDGRLAVSSQDPGVIGSRLPNWFDLVLVDAPCSGEGMFRKDAEAISEWSPAHVALCAARQTRILRDIWPALKPGGWLVYSTCTWNDQEDEQQVSQLLAQGDAELLAIHTEPSWGWTRTAMGEAEVVHAFPHRVQGEGLFMAVIQKTEGPEAGKRLPLRAAEPASKAERAALKPWLPEGWELIRHASALAAIPAHRLADINELAGAFPLLHNGIELAEMKGKDLRPAAAAAWWTALPSDLFPSLELPEQEALHYLRRDTQHLEAKKDWNLIRFRGVALGWAKGLGNRINNAYPQAWRLRMDLPSHQGPFSIFSSF